MTKNWNNNMRKVALGMVLVSLVLAEISHGQALREDGAEKVRQTAIRIGSGKKAKVEVRLLDKTKLKGRIASINTESFTLVEEKSGASRDILFSDVDRLKKRSGLSRAAWIGIAALAAAAAVIIGIVAARCRNEPGTCG